MIPLKLQIKNFLSYGNEIQTIDFTGYHLICLSGKNGHGKSALLDAITWALWGHARKVLGAVKADQGLLRLGQTQMMVILDFELGGNKYRVKREFMQTYGKPVAVLEFGMFDEHDQLIPLTDKTIRATQAKIEQTLNLDYDTFVNSAFLRQGSSNEFSKKSAKERKQILATILGLNEYETIRKLAMEKIRNAQAEKQALATLHESIMKELEKKPELIAQTTELHTILKTYATEEKKIVDQEKKLTESWQEIQKKEKEFELLTFKKEQAQQQLKTDTQKIFATAKEWRTVLKHSVKQGNYQALIAEQKKLVDEIKIHQQLLQKSLEFKQQRIQLEAERTKIEHSHTTNTQQELQKIAFNLEQLKAKENNLKNEKEKQKKTESLLHKDLAAIETKISELHAKSAALPKTDTYEKLQEQFEKRKEHYHRYITHGNLLKAELKALEQKQEMAHNEQDPSCPLCEQNLSATRKKFLKKKFDHQKNRIIHQLGRLTQIITSLKKLLITQHTQIQELITATTTAKELELTLQAHTNQKTELQKKLHELAAAGQRVEKEQLHTHKEIKNLDVANKNATAKIHAYKDDPAWKKIQKQLETLRQDAEKSAYNQEAHTKTTAALEKLEKQLGEFEQLKEKLALQDERAKQIAELVEQAKNAKTQIAFMEKEYATFTPLAHEKASFQEKAKEHATHKKELQAKKEQALQQYARLDEQLEKLKQLEQSSTSQLKKISSFNETISDYQEIAQATSKDGIQALLIEESIPEIEQEANDLLAKLTNNQSHIIIESLRDLKKGGTKETLDIKISDPTGIRPYELFSGGEAFRIDFALRIAISKLLARRAGTALQTLIIDEGFGSQDDEGLSRIMDAIYKIQDDFAKIIIVSHLASMKDQFPVHFVVEKGALGSSVQVFEQG